MSSNIFSRQQIANSTYGIVIHLNLFYIIIYSLLLFALLGVVFFLLGNILMKLYIFRYNPDNEKSSSQECGFFAKNDAPIKYEISFYTVGLTFLIFDLELLLVFPFIFSITQATTVSCYTIMIFLILLGLDFFLEIYNDILVIL